MKKIINLKPVVNKKNGQVTMSFPKKDMPKKFKDIIKSNPSAIKFVKFKFEGFS